MDQNWTIQRNISTIIAQRLKGNRKWGKRGWKAIHF
jgi:hypothetical protein